MEIGGSSSIRITLANSAPISYHVLTPPERLQVTRARNYLVVLQKLFEDKSSSSIPARYAVTPKI
jgi:hypothetical protein